MSEIAIYSKHFPLQEIYHQEPIGQSMSNDLIDETDEEMRRYATNEQLDLLDDLGDQGRVYYYTWVHIDESKGEGLPYRVDQTSLEIEVCVEQGSWPYSLIHQNGKRH